MTSRSRAVVFARIALLVVMLCGLGFLKLEFHPGLGKGAADGDYFFQIARHVAEGNGLVSNVSIFHQGFQSFPHRVAQAPLWLLTLGYVGRYFGLMDSALALPEALYMLDLVLLYLLANALRRSLMATGKVCCFGAVASWTRDMLRCSCSEPIPTSSTSPQCRTRRVFPLP